MGDEEEFESVEVSVDQPEEVKVKENEETGASSSEDENTSVTYTADVLEGKSFNELKDIKDSLGIEDTSNSKKGLIDLIVGQ